MLAWSLWMAQALLLRWLPWGFAQWSRGGIWRRRGAVLGASR
jgi:hypothetical protein